MKYIALFMVFVVSGCVSNGQHTYSNTGKCLTCWSNPITGEKINHSATDSYSEEHNLKKKQAQLKRQQAEREQRSREEDRAKRLEAAGRHLAHWDNYSKACFGKGAKIDLVIDSNHDVDTTYNRIKREFKLRLSSHSERDDQVYAAARGEKHEILTGVRYSIIEAGLDHMGEDNLQIGFDIEKEGVNKSRVYYWYCEGGPWGHSQVKSVFKVGLMKRVKNTLR